MRFFRARWVRRTGPGRYAVDLDDGIRELLEELAATLAELLTETTDDPKLRRLFPTAYHEDVERDREYQQLVRDELLSRRLAELETLRTTVGQTELDEAGLSAWMRSINDLRLVLGTALDVSEDLPDVDPDDPETADYVLYEALGQLLVEIVDALEGDLPSP